MKNRVVPSFEGKWRYCDLLYMLKSKSAATSFQNLIPLTEKFILKEYPISYQDYTKAYWKR